MTIEVKFTDKRAHQFFAEVLGNVKNVSEHHKNYINLLSAPIFSDIVEHFEQEAGPDGRWRLWSKIYAERMRRIGKGGNKILQDTGRLKGAFKPSNYRKVSDGILWFNNAKTASGFPYAAAHDQGGSKLPQRKFMWLSDKAMEQMEAITIRYLER